MMRTPHRINNQWTLDMLGVCASSVVSLFSIITLFIISMAWNVGIKIWY